MSQRITPNEPKSKPRSRSKFRLSKPPSAPHVLGAHDIVPDIQFLFLDRVSPEESRVEGEKHRQSQNRGTTLSSAKAASNDDDESSQVRVTEFDSRGIAQPFLDGEEALVRLRVVREELRKVRGEMK